MLGDIPICYINKEIELKTPCVSIKQKITKHFTGDAWFFKLDENLFEFYSRIFF